MRLPNTEFVVVEREKITEYLLNPEHRYGASKARFFAGFGFTLEAWDVLASALGSTRSVTKSLERTRRVGDRDLKSMAN